MDMQAASASVRPPPR